MKHKIVLLKDGKKVFQMNIKPSKKSKLGDSDIMLDAGKGMYFDHVVLGNYFKHYKLPEFEINSLSWHGYYEIIDERQLYSPVVHIKSHSNKIDRVGHLGSINDFEPFAFPVCSIYIPSDLNDVFIRIVGDPSNLQIASDSGKQIFKEISEQYSIIINDPNDIYNKLAYKPVIMYDENGNMMKPRVLKDIHEEEIEFITSEELRIWDDFYK